MLFERVMRRAGCSSLIRVSDGEAVVIAGSVAKPNVSESIKCVWTEVLCLRNKPICLDIIDLFISYISLSSGIDKLFDDPSGD